MANWTIRYSEINIVGIAVHGVITIYDSSGNFVGSFQGLATTPQGTNAPLGAQILGDTLGGYYNVNNPPISDVFGDSPTYVATVFSGTQQQVMARVDAMAAATDLYNSGPNRQPYQLPGPIDLLDELFGGNGNNTNSNSYITTMFQVLGQPVPSSGFTTLLGQEGGDTSLLTPAQIAAIDAPYGSNFSVIPDNL